MTSKIAATIVALVTSVLPSTTTYVAPPAPPAVVYYQPSPQQITFTEALAYCESRGIETALNPADSNNLPSRGKWQFQDSTFRAYSVRYGVLKPEDIDTTEKLLKAMYNAEIQQKIVYEMLNDTKINWRREFPLCVKQLGNPPK